MPSDILIAPPDRAARPTSAEARRTVAERICEYLLKERSIGGDPALCAGFRLLRDRTGQNKFQYVASVIGGTKPGRKAIDDRAALRRIEASPPDRRREAVGKLALQMAGGDENKADTIAHRWREKLRKKAGNKKEEIDASAGSGS